MFRRLSDESLGSRLASGEAAAFDELYRRYVHRLAAYGSHLLGDPAAGDDVAQAALLKAYGALRDGRVPDKMRPWLFRIAHNAAIDLVVRRRELPTEHLPERPTREPEPMAGALVASLAALPDRQRQVYVLRELHGMRIDETAAELALTSVQVEQALFAARNRLAELLVFGDSLDCVTVRRLSAGPLDADERRALKTHLRSCSACRSAVGLRARVLGWLPGSTLEWLRGLLVSGAAPAAAKVGAVVATATIAAGVPVAVESAHHHRRATHHHNPPVSAPVVSVAPVVRSIPVARRPLAAVPTHVAVAHHDEPVTRIHDGGSGGGDDSTIALPRTSGDGGSDGGGAGDRPTAVETGGGGDGGKTTEAAPATTTNQSDGGRDGSSGGESSTGSDGSSGSDGDSTTTPSAATLPTTTVETPPALTAPTTTSSSDDG